MSGSWPRRFGRLANPIQGNRDSRAVYSNARDTCSGFWDGTRLGETDESRCCKTWTRMRETRDDGRLSTHTRHQMPPPSNSSTSTTPAMHHSEQGSERSVWAKAPRGGLPTQSEVVGDLESTRWAGGSLRDGGWVALRCSLTAALVRCDFLRYVWI